MRLSQTSTSKELPYHARELFQLSPLYVCLKRDSSHSFQLKIISFLFNKVLQLRGKDYSCYDAINLQLCEVAFIILLQLQTTLKISHLENVLYQSHLSWKYPNILVTTVWKKNLKTKRIIKLKTLLIELYLFIYLKYKAYLTKVKKIKCFGKKKQKLMLFK